LNGAGHNAQPLADAQVCSECLPQVLEARLAAGIARMIAAGNGAEDQGDDSEEEAELFTKMEPMPPIMVDATRAAAAAIAALDKDEVEEEFLGAMAELSALETFPEVEFRPDFDPNDYVETYQVYVKVGDKTKFILSINDGNTVADIKGMIQAVSEIPTKMQRLMMDGKYLKDDDGGIERDANLHLTLVDARLPGGGKRPRKGGEPSAGVDATDEKQDLIAKHKKVIDGKMYDSRATDSNSLQAVRGEIERFKGLTEAQESQTLTNVLMATPNPTLKKLQECVLGKNNEQKYRLLKGIVFPNYVPVIKSISGIIKDIEDGMFEVTRLLVADGFMNDAGDISWMNMHVVVQEAISRQDRMAGAHAAAAQAAAAQAANRDGMALG